MASKFHKNLYLQKGFDRNGNSIVQGGVKFFIKKPYGKNECVSLREVTINGTTKSVANLSGFLKVDDFLQKQLKYFFNVDVPMDELVNINVSVWGKTADILSKFNVQEGNLYFFLVSGGKIETFDRKNGGVGYQLSFNAFDFEPLRTGNKGNENNNSAENHQPEAQPAAQAAPAQVPNFADSMQAAFDAIDDSEDLPF